MQGRFFFKYTRRRFKHAHSPWLSTYFSKAVLQRVLKQYGPPVQVLLADTQPVRAG